MQLNGKSSSKRQLNKKVCFFLDECLPYQMAYFLQTVDYPITSWHEEFKGQQGVKDTPLIQYLRAKEYTWITKDDKAKREHENDIRTAGISVMWIRGLERQKRQPKKNKIRNKDLLRMLTDKLDSIQREISDSKTSLYYLLSVKTGYKGELIPIARKITLEHFFKEHLPKLNTTS